MRHVWYVWHGTLGFIFILYAVTGYGNQWGVKAWVIKRCSVFNFYETLIFYLEKKDPPKTTINKILHSPKTHHIHHITSHDLRSCSDLCLDLLSDHRLTSMRIIWKIHFYQIFMCCIKLLYSLLMPMVPLALSANTQPTECPLGLSVWWARFLVHCALPCLSLFKHSTSHDQKQLLFPLSTNITFF